MTPDTVFTTDLKGLKRLHRGKVRDIYDLPGGLMLIVTSDRLSAFDVVLPDPIPYKGQVLTEISNFWFARLRHLIPNHLSGIDFRDYISDADEVRALTGRTLVVRKLKALPFEAVVRGYLSGSGWKDYQRSGEICGLRLPAGLRLADQLPEPIFTPATKAPLGAHDENVSYAHVVEALGGDLAAELRSKAVALYMAAATHARARGIIIADTKFEFGLDDAGQLVLIDEALTPDSSRFWPVESYAPGVSPPSFDKQFVRDYLETLDWNKQAPGPHLPPEIIARTSEKYRAALEKLTAP